MTIAEVRVSAPAKVLLFGEHAVVYGCPAIAASLSDLRITATVDRVECTQQETPAVELVFKDIVSHVDKAILRRSFEVHALNRVVQGMEDDRFFVPKPSEEVIARIDELLKIEHEEDAAALRPALYLCCALLRSTPVLQGTNGGLRIHIAAKNFPIGAGLGSSAALCVALSAALVAVRSESVTIGDRQDFINTYAFSAEVIMHGSPSGVDNTVSTYGGTLVYHKLPTPSFRKLHSDLSKFRFVLVNTKVPRSTKEQVGNVRKLFEADQAATQKQFDKIEAITHEFITRSELNTLSHATLGKLMERNHDILNALGVGHEQLELVSKICKRYGGFTKLTGAGGGGCAVSLLPEGMDDATMHKLIAELEAQHFQCYLSSVGGAGAIHE